MNMMKKKSGATMARVAEALTMAIAIPSRNLRRRAVKIAIARGLGKVAMRIQSLFVAMDHCRTFPKSKVA